MLRRFPSETTEMKIFLLSLMISWAGDKPVTLTTEHFEVITTENYLEIGQIYAQKLETAHKFLTPYFKSQPKKTIVVIKNKSDQTNGAAGRVPYPMIEIEPVLPGSMDSIAEYDDWFLELLTHEYTHIHTFETVEGPAASLESIFGTIISPNLLLPRWWKEGIAVEMETLVANGGRLRSSQQDVILRALVSSGSLQKFTIADINEFLPSWPEGQRPYLFGSLFWSDAVAEKSPSIIAKLHSEHGAQFPYFINAAAENYLGEFYESYYIKALRRVEAKVQAQLDILKMQNPTPLRKVFKNLADWDIRFSSDGNKIAVIKTSDLGSREIKIYDRKDLLAADSGSQEKIPSLNTVRRARGTISDVNWFPNEDALIFDQIRRPRFALADWFSWNKDVFSDLYKWNFATEKPVAITRNARAREASVTADGKWIYFVGLEPGKTFLGRVENNPQKFPYLNVERLWLSEYQERISNPVPVNDHEILFTLRKLGGDEGFYIYSLNDKTLKPVLQDFKPVRFPRISRQQLYFTSLKSGVPNIYLSKDFKTAQPLTHLLSGTFKSDEDPITHNLFLIAMNEDGPKLHEVKNSDLFTNKKLPEVKGLLADRYPAHANPKEVHIIPDQSDYQAHRYLLPRYWLPFIGASLYNSSVVLSAATSGTDPLNHHSYVLSYQYDFGLKDYSLFANYTNAQWKQPFGANFQRDASYLGNFDNIYSQELVEPFWKPYPFVQLEYRYLTTKTNSLTTRRGGPTILLSASTVRKGLSQISPEEGVSAALGFSQYYMNQDPSSYQSTFFYGSLFQHFDFLPEHHAFALFGKAFYTPQPIDATLGVASEPFRTSQRPNNFLMRGYGVSGFIGKTMANANGEYRFPILDLYRGAGTTPFYAKRIWGLVFADALQTEGLVYDADQKAYVNVGMDRTFVTPGFEIHLDVGLGYILPADLFLGVYFPQTSYAGSRPNYVISLDLANFP